MPRYESVIWDFNGTLFNDSALCHEIMNEQCAHLNLPEISFAEYRQIFTFPVKAFYEKLGCDFSKIPYENVAQYFIDEYNRRRYSCELHADVRETLSLFLEHDIRQYVLSAYRHEDLLALLKHYGIDSFFESVSGIDDHYAHGKIEQGKKLLKTMSSPPEKIVLVGDTIHDFEVSVHLGIHSLLIAGGHQSSERLYTCNTTVLQSVNEVKKYIL